MATIHYGTNGLKLELDSIRRNKRKRFFRSACLAPILAAISILLSLDVLWDWFEAHAPAVDLFDPNVSFGLQLITYILIFSTFIQFTFRYVIPIKLGTWLFRNIRDLFQKDSNQRILEVGLAAETEALQFLSLLPDQYHIFTNLRIPYQDKVSETDLIVLGPTGIFVIEVKGYKGTLRGRWSDHNLVHQKGTHAASEEYNPVKQISSHLYRLSRSLREHGFDRFVNGFVFFTDPSLSLEVSGAAGNQCRIFTYDSREWLLYDILNGKSCLKQDEQRQIVRLLDQLI